MVFVDELPRTVDGKVLWSALPSANLTSRPETQTPPSTPTEEAITEIWQRVLRVPEIGVHDDLFALGGTSLAATRIAEQVGATFHFRMPVTEIFRSPTVAGTALYIEGRQSIGEVNVVQLAN